MSAATVMTFLYGVLALVGGIIGFVQARSKMSLISGVITGVLLIIAGFGLTQAQGWALGVAIAIAALLVVVFVGRLVKTRKFMPAGLMVIAGVATLAALLSTFR